MVGWYVFVLGKARPVQMQKGVWPGPLSEASSQNSLCPPQHQSCAFIVSPVRLGPRVRKSPAAQLAFPHPSQDVAD